MLFQNKEAIKNAIFPKPLFPQFDQDDNPIYRGDGRGIDYSKVIPPPTNSKNKK